LTGVVPFRVEPHDDDFGGEGPSRVLQCLFDAQVDVFYAILAHYRNAHPVRVFPADETVPFCIWGPLLETQVVSEGIGKPLLLEFHGDLVDVGDRCRTDDAIYGKVTERRYLSLCMCPDRPLAPAHDDIGMETELAQRLDRVLRRLGLQVAHRVLGDQRHVYDDRVLGRQFSPHLPDRLEKRHALDVSDRPPDLDEADLRGRLPSDLFCRSSPDARLYLVSDVRDDLDGLPEKVPAPFLLDHRAVHFSRGDVVGGSEVDVEEPLVVPEVEVDFAPV